jgi:3-oxoacyl-[acyl-carrier-protein] synthase-3
MGAIAEALGSAPPRTDEVASSRALAARAAAAALAAAGVDPGDVDLVINVGVYRDENICEPAMAPFVQRAIGANPSVRAGSRRTFSFDVANGACGAITASQIADGFIRSGRARRALIVASDVDPRPGASEGCDLDPTAAALLLSAGGIDEGFLAFHSETFGKHANLLEGGAVFMQSRAGAGAGHYGLRIRRAREYTETCAECAAVATQRFLRERELELESLDLVVPSCAPPGFAAALGERLGLALEPFASEFERAHSAAPLLALASVLRDRAATASRTLLWVAAGSGITISLALYRG